MAVGGSVCAVHAIVHTISIIRCGGRLMTGVDAEKEGMPTLIKWVSVGSTSFTSDVSSRSRGASIRLLLGDR